MSKALVCVAGAIGIAFLMTRVPEFGLDVRWEVCGISLAVSRPLATFVCTYVLALAGFLMAWKR